MWGGKEFHIFGAEIQKAREPNKRLCHGTESNLKKPKVVFDMSSCRVHLLSSVLPTDLQSVILVFPVTLPGGHDRASYLNLVIQDLWKVPPCWRLDTSELCNVKCVTSKITFLIPPRIHCFSLGLVECWIFIKVGRPRHNKIWMR